MKQILLLITCLLFTGFTLKAVDLPLTFESGTYDITNFDGGALTIIDNPSSTGINTSAKVAQMIKGAGQPWGGAYVTLDNPVDFSAGKTFKMKVWAPKVGTKVLLKLENATNANIFFEKEVETTTANEWEELTFDFGAVDDSQEYVKVVLIFELGTTGDGTANFTYYLDDIQQEEAGSSTELPSFPIDFESDNVDYTFTNFDGGETTLEFNPNQSGINTSSQVAKMVKNPGQPWGGSWIGLKSPVNFENGRVFKMKFHSPRVGANVLFKLENLSDGQIFHEDEATTTVANEWEELTFDLSTIDASQSYRKITIIVDNGTAGDGSENFTFYFDDIVQFDASGEFNLPDVPIDFESDDVDYVFTDFDGGEATVVDNPNSSGINTSAKVGQMVKNEGEVFGGSFLSLANALDFENNNTFKMKVHVPKVGTRVLLKVENSNNPNISYEQQVETSTANEWEELSFDYSEINAEDTYDRIVLIFDNGTVGDGSADFTYYFDDIALIQELDPLTLPIEFESPRADYTFTNFDGATAQLLENPDASGINLSPTVAQLIKGAGQPWAGSYLTLGSPIDFSADSLFKVKVHAPRVGTKVLLKVENLTDSGIFFEQEVETTLANEWEDLVFNFSEIDQAEEYQKIVLIFDNGTVGDGSAGFTYYFDDIRLGNENLTVPLTAAPVPPIYSPYRVLAVFSDVNNQKPNTNFEFMNPDSTETELISIDGDVVLEYKNFQRITMVLEEEYDLNYMKFVHVDIYPTESFDVYVKPLTLFRRRFVENVDTVSLVANQWNSLEIPFEDFVQLSNGNPMDMRRFTGFRLETDISSNPTIYVDNVYIFDDFVDDEAPDNLSAEIYATTDKTVIFNLTGEDNSGEFFFDVSYDGNSVVLPAESGVTISPVIFGLEPGTAYTFDITAHDNDGNESDTVIQVVVTTLENEPAPLTAAPVPTYPSEEVISLFSDSYTQATNWAPGAWNQQTLLSTVQIEENATLKMTNFNFQGIEINGNTPGFDASTSDSLHLDVWTPNAPGFTFGIISESAAGKFLSEVDVALEPGRWNSVNIPVSDFIAANPDIELENLIQLRLVSPDHQDRLPLDDIIYIDNLMFTGVDVLVDIEEVSEEDDIQVFTTYGSLVVNTPNSTRVEVYSLTTGSLVFSGICHNHLDINLNGGFYVVKAGNKVVKCYVWE